MLVQIAREWTPPRFPARSIETLDWADSELTACARTIELDNDTLRLICYPKAEVMEGDEPPFSQLRNKPIKGTTQDGYSFSAAAALTTNHTISDKAGTSGGSHRVDITAYDWAIWNKTRPALLWVAISESLDNEQLGNLLLTTAGGGGGWGHYRLQGSTYVYYLLNTRSKRNNKQLLVIDCGKSPFPEAAIVSRELNCLSLAFGSPISIEHIFGLDVDRRVCGISGGRYLERPHGRWWDSTVPMFEFKHTWVAPFFRKLCEFQADHDLDTLGEYVLGIWYLITAYRETAGDIRRMNVLLGLTCLAQYVTGNVKSLADFTEWNNWINANREHITSKAFPEFQTYLLDQVRRALIPDNTTLIRVALGTYHLSPDAELLSTVATAADSMRGRATASQRDHLVDLARLRTMLVALVAKTIGYNAPIAGWNRVDDYYYWDRAPSSWWPSDTDPMIELESATTFHAKTERYGASVKNLWPDFPMLTAPVEGLLAVIESFASALALKTNGIVLAKLQAIPRADVNASQVYDFVLYSVTDPRTRSILFSTYQIDENQLCILDWKENDQTIDGPQQLEAFLGSVANASETKMRIEQIMQSVDLVAQ